MARDLDTDPPGVIALAFGGEVLPEVKVDAFVTEWASEEVDGATRIVIKLADACDEGECVIVLRHPNRRKILSTQSHITEERK